MNAKETVLKFMKPLDCELATESVPKRCSSWDVTDDNVLNLLNAESSNSISDTGSYGREQVALDVFANGTTSGQNLLFYILVDASSY